MASNATNSLIGLGRDVLLQIGSLVPIEMVEMAPLNKQIAAVAPQAFGYVEELYARNATIAQFMPSPTAAALSSKANVQHTVGNIFRLAKLSGQDYLEVPPHPEYLECMIEQATRVFNPFILAELGEMIGLDFSNNPSPKDLESLIQNVKTILEQRPQGPGTDPHWRQLLMSAVKSSHYLRIEALLTLFALSSGVRSDAVKAAVAYNDSGKLDLLVRRLLGSGPILKPERGETLLSALIKDRTYVATLLLESGPISDEDRETAVFIATGRWSPEQVKLVKALLESGPISEKSRENALVRAVEKKHFPEFVTTLLESGPISDRGRRRAIVSAMDVDASPEIIRALVPRTIRGRVALIASLQIDHPEMVARLRAIEI